MEQKVQADELLKAGKTVQIGPQGYSMYPLLLPGRDQVIVAPAEREKYKRGDVVLYRRDGSILVLHRIWKRKKDGYYMVGDNQSKIEGPIRRDQILGEMVCVLRKGKKIPVDNAGYRVLTGVWLALRPARPVLSHFVAWIKRILRKFIAFFR